MKSLTQALLILGILALTVFAVACTNDNLAGEARARYSANPTFNNYAAYRMTAAGLSKTDQAMVTKYVKDSFSACVEKEGMTVSEFYSEKINKKVDVANDEVIGGVTACMKERVEQLQSRSTAEEYKNKGFSQANTRKINAFANDFCSSEKGCLVGFSEQKQSRNLIGYGFSVAGDPTGDDRWVMVTYTTDATGWWS